MSGVTLADYLRLHKVDLSSTYLHVIREPNASRDWRWASEQNGSLTDALQDATQFDTSHNGAHVWKSATTIAVLLDTCVKFNLTSSDGALACRTITLEGSGPLLGGGCRGHGQTVITCSFMTDSLVDSNSEPQATVQRQRATSRFLEGLWFPVWSQRRRGFVASSSRSTNCKRESACRTGASVLMSQGSTSFRCLTRRAESFFATLACSSVASETDGRCTLKREVRQGAWRRMTGTSISRNCAPE